MTLIERLRALLNSADITVDQYETVCDAIRELGGRP